MLNTRIGENFNANDVINSNDLRKRIINVDSRFRSNLCDPTTDFTYNLEHPYKNLIRLRIASVEIPNMWYVFTKNNVTFTIKAYDITGIVREIVIKISEGNYNSVDFLIAVQEALNRELRDAFGIYMTASLDIPKAKVLFVHNGVSAYPVTDPDSLPTESAKPFIISFIPPGYRGDKHKPMKATKRNLGIGHNLGFRNFIYKASITRPSTLVAGLTTYIIEPEGCLDVVGDTYMFLSVNDYYSVEQRTDQNYIQCLAKIIVREDKYMVIYDDGATLMSNEIIFPSPTYLKILQVKLLDPYGEVIDLCGMNFSFSLEITEVLNTKLYDFYRNYIWLGSIPSVNYKTVQGSAQPLLRGIGPPW